MDQAFQTACTALGLGPRHIPQWPFSLLSVTEDIMKQLGQHKAVGLYGMAGVGKTTIASAVFNCMHTGYQRVFLGIGQAHGDKLEEMQRQLLQDVGPPALLHYLGHQQLTAKIRNRLQQTKLLIVLDDVCSEEQLERLLGPCHEKSRILITSRNHGLLRIVLPYVICSPVVSNQVDKLAEGPSQHLFNLLAFNMPCAPRDLSDRAKAAAQMCKGLPLSIYAMATYLAAKDASAWPAAYEGLQNAILPSQDLDNGGCTNPLREYQNLMPQFQTIFLDIACFMHGQPVADAVHLWGRHGQALLKPLQYASLVEVSSGILDMAWQLRSQGRAITADGKGPSSMRYLRFPSASLPSSKSFAEQVYHAYVCELGAPEYLTHLQASHSNANEPW